MYELKTIIPNVFMLEPNEKIDVTKFSDQGNYFFIHNRNVWQLLISPVTKCLLPCDNAEKLLKEFLGATPHNPENGTMYDTIELKITAEQFGWTMQYFRDIFAKYRTEACVVLMFNTATKHFRVLPVVQYNMSHSGVHYFHPGNSEVNMEEAKPLHAIVKNKYDEWYAEGYRFYGTIHSHSDFKAFYSGTDDADDDKNDGIHITIGNVNKNWSFAARHTVRGFHWDIPKIDDVLDTPIEDIIKLVEEGAFVVEEDYMKLALVSSRETHWKMHNQDDKSRQKATNLLPKDKIDLEAYVDHPNYRNEIFAADEMVKIYDSDDGRYYFVRKSFFVDHENRFNRSLNLFVVDVNEEFEEADDLEEKVHEQVEKLWDENDN